MLYIEMDDQCDKLLSRSNADSRQFSKSRAERPQTKLATLATIDVPWRNFANPELQREVGLHLFWRYPNFPAAV